MKTFFVVALSLVLAACASGPPRPTPGKPMTLRLIGHTTLPHKLSFQNTVFGGISGIDYDADNDQFVLLSDDRSDHSPARFYTAKIDYDETALKGVSLTAAITLKQPDGSVFPNNKTPGANVPDPESIRIHPTTKTLWWTSEGDKRAGLSPFIREMKWDGSFLRELILPPMFAMQPPNVNRGPRDNLTFEGMAISLDGNALWVSLEAPLFEDGDPARVGAASGPTRFTRFDLGQGTAWDQFTYSADAIAQAPIPATGFADNGVVEIVMAYEHRMLVLERAFSQGVGNSIRLYGIETRDGSEVLSFPALRNAGARSVPKQLVLDFSTLNIRIDNIEAMAFGKRLGNGKRSLVFASDDNFNARQITQFLVFEVDE
jgi:hypothetical protein